MPMDTRRLPVPEESQSPLALSNRGSIALAGKDLVDINGKRKDGRVKFECRPMFVKPGVVSQAKGSAYIENDQTKVICAVYGPREVLRKEDFSMNGQLYCEFKFTTFSRPVRKGHQQNAAEKDISLLIKNALEPAVRLDKFPKARVDIFITVLQDDGSSVASALSCASVALADAGIEMYDLVVGSSLRQFGDLILFDPKKDEEYEPKKDETCKNNGDMTLGFMPSMSQVTAVNQSGEFELSTLSELMQASISNCHQIYPLLQRCLEKSVKLRMAKS